MGAQGAPNGPAYSADSSSLDEFAKSTQGQKWSTWVTQLNAAKAGKAAPTPDSSVGSLEDFNNEYAAWLASQQKSNKDYQAYKTLAQEQSGRDATILTGPASTKSILG